MIEFNNFVAKQTDSFIYIGSKVDENIRYRISGKINELWPRLFKPTIKLIPFLKQLDSHKSFSVETRTTKNLKTGEWLWSAGYQRFDKFPSGTVGGLNCFGTTFSGEYSENGRPVQIGNNRNSQNKGALKSSKTLGSIEYDENRPKFSESELIALEADRIRREY